jgi:epoxide hydrolase
VPVQKWMAADFPDIRHFAIMPKGGHFAAFEQPVLFVNDLRTYFRLLRS